MRKIDKSLKKILSTEYKNWVDGLEAQGKRHPLSRTYYDDVIMNLLYCQDNVCAYTEICLCNGKFTKKENWVAGRFNAPAGYKRNDHFGELEHFDPDLKSDKYWLWENLFMVNATVNGNKSNNRVYDYLKPDLDTYAPERYFDYDPVTHLFTPNSNIENQRTIDEIQYMIDEVLYLNHGGIVKAREEYINNIRLRSKDDLAVKPIDQFFTATEWTLHGKPEAV